ncbi:MULTISPECIES: hypothetical protein [unclassified Bacillus (in: firmicutes)]|nr:MULTISPECIES: hypothetical protein [unclassified Bacillus (in: firmicutes)]
MFKKIAGVNSDIEGNAKLWRYMDITPMLSKETNHLYHPLSQFL